jgi:hypothetical protein
MDNKAFKYEIQQAELQQTELQQTELQQAELQQAEPQQIEQDGHGHTVNTASWNTLMSLTGDSEPADVYHDAPSRSAPCYQTSYDRRLPASLMPAGEVNVFEFEVSSFNDDAEPDNGKGQAMQERSGSGLLGQGRTNRSGQPSHSMDQIQEMDEDDGPGASHVELAKRAH